MPAGQHTGPKYIHHHHLGRCLGGTPGAPNRILGDEIAGALGHGPKSYKSIGFADIHGTKAYKSIGLGDIHDPKAYKSM